ncbi:MAG: hypothetical protein A3I05_05230 [Deltaproteobacteria bacterium RIFCSPLOWO2_02_FULL_44_10]|nr:MAG: hypothetical protein A3C46_05985 [Deltaproteobacteria bacterium RIFCSPHIGHO2_02_FULL_44_16]OGQ45994.1 MAG: hypothetical protein A3I05_05230 [Deltaproteobacteria bacterium RIFCSPLOWO2_02_FULL_44_10]
MNTALQNDYSLITERAGANVTQEQLLRVYQRYVFAAQYCHGKDVLEAACGSGVGLGLLGDVAHSVTALDCERKNLFHAETTYQQDSKVRILHGDAQAIPFPDKSFDVVILYEAIYYLSHPEKFFAECKRVLRSGGRLIIGSANREWADFNPSIYSTRYFSASELYEMMEKEGFQTKIYKGFPIEESQGGKQKVLSLMKRVAVKLHCIPKSMKYKKFLKRIFVGQLVPLPPRLTQGSVEYREPTPLSLGKETQFKVIYAVGHYHPEPFGLAQDRLVEGRGA